MYVGWDMEYNFSLYRHVLSNANFLKKKKKERDNVANTLLVSSDTDFNQKLMQIFIS